MPAFHLYDNVNAAADLDKALKWAAYHEHPPLDRMVWLFLTYMSVRRPTENWAFANLLSGHRLEDISADTGYWRSLADGKIRMCQNVNHVGEMPPATEEYFYTSEARVSRFNPRGFHSYCKDCERRRLKMYNREVRKSSRYTRKLITLEDRKDIAKAA